MSRFILAFVITTVAFIFTATSQAHSLGVQGSVGHHAADVDAHTLKGVEVNLSLHFQKPFENRYLLLGIGPTLSNRTLATSNHGKGKDLEAKVAVLGFDLIGQLQATATVDIYGKFNYALMNTGWLKASDNTDVVVADVIITGHRLGFGTKLTVNDKVKLFGEFDMGMERYAFQSARLNGHRTRLSSQAVGTRTLLFGLESLL